MTRATWPLSRDAVEAAAEKLWAEFGHFYGTRRWPEVIEPEKEGWRELAANILRSALAAWVPSEGQAKSFKRGARGAAMSVYMGESGEACEARCNKAGILAAVRTEAAE